MNIIQRIKHGVKRRLEARPTYAAATMFFYDFKRFVKYAGCFHTDRQEALRASVIMAGHVIEKGLTMPRRRLGFGNESMLNLMSLVTQYESLYGSNDKMVSHAAGLVRDYLLMHEKANYDFTAKPQYWASIRSFCDLHKTAGDSKQLHFTTDEFFRHVKSDFADFARSRHTVRHFSGEVTDDEVTSSVKLAMTAPSACNRQHVRVHCISSKETMREIYALQGGNRGFGEDASKLLVITTDLEDIRWAAERNDAYTNAGIFVMNMCYALHYNSIGSCILNWSASPSADQMLRKIISIRPSESVVVLIACGMPPDEFDVASSPRKDISEILINA